ncbi:hypothetical protein RYA05_01125 [Pseudomonas syringae pv. actinidiae]|nr:hypothetical protein [Pseudomonas syringae pv. actinidiae]
MNELKYHLARLIRSKALIHMEAWTLIIAVVVFLPSVLLMCIDAADNFGDVTSIIALTVVGLSAWGIASLANLYDLIRSVKTSPLSTCWIAGILGGLIGSAAYQVFYAPSAWLILLVALIQLIAIHWVWAFRGRISQAAHAPLIKEDFASNPTPNIEFLKQSAATALHSKALINIGAISIIPWLLSTPVMLFGILLLAMGSPVGLFAVAGFYGLASLIKTYHVVIGHKNEISRVYLYGLGAGFLSLSCYTFPWYGLKEGAVIFALGAFTEIVTLHWAYLLARAIKQGRVKIVKLFPNDNSPFPGQCD